MRMMDSERRREESVRIEEKVEKEKRAETRSARRINGQSRTSAQAFKSCRLTFFFPASDFLAAWVLLSCENVASQSSEPGL